MKKLRAMLERTDFYLERHQRVFDAMCELDDDGMPVDLVLLKAQLERTRKLEAIGGFRTLSELLDRAGTVTNLGHYMVLVKRESLRRQIVVCSQQINADVMQADDEAEERLQTNIDTIRSLSAKLERVGKKTRKWDDVVFEVVEKATNKTQPKPRKPFGLTMLDDMLNGGIRDGWLVMINALSGGGKTALAFGNLAMNLGSLGQRVFIVSLEMNDDELVERAIAGETGVEAWRLDTGKVFETRFMDVIDAGVAIAAYDFEVNSVVSSFADLEAAVLEAHTEKPLDAVVVDYAQLIDNSIEGEQNIAKTSRGCKQLAQKLGVPFVLLTQSTVAVNREGRAPKAADGKGSGALQADADLILAPHIIEPKDGERPDICPAEIWVRKQRKGRTGRVGGLVFDGPRCKFREPTLAEIEKGLVV